MANWVERLLHPGSGCFGYQFKQKTGTVRFMFQDYPGWLHVWQSFMYVL